VIAVTVVQEISKKEHVMRLLMEMELEQLAKWVEILPESQWEELFAAGWPVLARKFGIVRKAT